MSEGAGLVGRRLADRYAISSVLARGGMATVYVARDERLARDVAVKVLASPYAEDAGFVARFLDEARAAASISHPSLVHVYDSGSDTGSHFIVMELLDRHRTLRSRIDEGGPLGRDEVLRIGDELLAGLEVVHARGLVHCDVTAANVMLGPGPSKLIDFGIATAPHGEVSGDTSLGSLASISPEQLRGAALGPAADLFGVGVVLYEALTGRLPYPGASPDDVARRHVADVVEPPTSIIGGTAVGLDDVLLRALRRDPSDRFADAPAMREALATASGAREESRSDETRPMPTSRPNASDDVAAPWPTSAPAMPRRTRRWVGVGAVLAIAAIGAVALIAFDLPGGGLSASPTPRQSLPAGQVEVPSVIGEATADAIELARTAGLRWTIYCDDDAARPEGIVDQEPPAGTIVAPGATFSMYSARIADCR